MADQSQGSKGIALGGVEGRSPRLVAPIAHGGSLSSARKLFPGAPEPLVDLSTGINPVPYPIPALPAEAFTRLPEPGAVADVEAMAAQAYGVADPAMVVAAPGTQALIQILPRLFARRTVAVLGPTYAEHGACWTAAGHDVRMVDGVEAADWAGTLILCNPNNPDGRRIAPSVLLSGHRALLVVDEAFADFEPRALSVAPALPRPGLVVLRSFGKTYGLAGVRLGFALASPDLASALRAALGPWAVSGPALAIGAAALADPAWLARAGARLARDAARLDGLLIGAGFSLVGGTMLYRLAAHPDAAAIFVRLGRAGIFPRRFAERGDWLRFGIPASDAVFERLAAALSL